VLKESEDNGKSAKAFEELGVEDINSFIFMEQSDFKRSEAKLNVLQIKKLVHSKAWYRAHPNFGSLSAWFELTHEILNTFAARGIHHVSPTASVPSPSAIIPDVSESVTSPVASSPSPSADFLKGIKRDVTQYQDFTDDKKWLLWKRHLKAMAPIHGLDHILEEYKPVTASDVELFKQQQHFAFSIFSRCLKTSKSLKFLRDFEATHDAQALFK
jgi:hypothetical protein